MYLTRFAALAATLLAPAMAVAGDLRADANAVFKPIDAASVASVVKNNEITPAKIDLGSKLFFDPRLSKSQIISCNSCHNLGTGGVDAGPTSIGHGWAKGPRRAPTVLNAVFNVAQFWDGRAVDLKAQAKGPVQADVEMNNTPAQVEKMLNSMPAYVAEFKAAFPADPKPVSFDNMAKAIEAFEATLTTPNAPFDKFLKGDVNALNDVEKKGLRLFIDKGCAACHGGVNIGGNGYFPLASLKSRASRSCPSPTRAAPRSPMTQRTTSSSVLRRCATWRLRAPYFHTGTVRTLEEAVDLMAKDQLGENLSDPDVKAIVAFLGTLNGDQPKAVYPVLPPRTKDTPLPQ